MARLLIEYFRQLYANNTRIRNVLYCKVEEIENHINNNNIK